MTLHHIRGMGRLSSPDQSTRHVSGPKDPHHRHRRQIITEPSSRVSRRRAGWHGADDLVNMGRGGTDPE